MLKVDKLNLDGPVPQVLALVGKWGTGGIIGNIPPSTVSLANGEAQTNLTINIDTITKDERGRDVTEPAPLKLTGGVSLADMKLRNVMVDISKNLLREEIRKVAPNGASIPMTGLATKPSIDVGKFIAENAVRGIIGGGGDGGNPLGNILGGNRGQEPPPRNPPRPNR